MLYLVCYLRFLLEWWWSGELSESASVAARLVPLMIVLYTGASLWILLLYAERILPAFAVILSDAFTGQAVAGGALGMVIVTGVRRAAFSNEAGMGTGSNGSWGGEDEGTHTGRVGGNVGAGD
jgi:Na+/alanine symporter